MQTEPNRRHKLWKEVEPIVNHAVAVLILEGCLLVVGLLTRGLELLFPQQTDTLLIVEAVDTWTALAILCLFALYTLLQVSLRLFRALSREWQASDEELKGATLHD